MRPSFQLRSEVSQGCTTTGNNQNLEKSVQELYRRLEEKDGQIEQLQQQINKLKEKIELKNK